MRFLLQLLKKLKLLETINFSATYSFNDSITIPIINSIGYDHFFEFEIWLNTLIKNLILEFKLEQNCFVDVGTNIGQTLLKVKSLNKNIEYIGFEPNPTCLFYLYKLIRVNNFENVQIFPFALSDKSGVVNLDFYGKTETDSSASVVSGFRKNALNTIKIPALGQNEISQLSINKVGIVKIDVEGGELEVVKGLYPVLKGDRPFIICEVLPVYSSDNIFRLSRQEELESLLCSLNYNKALILDPGILVEKDSIGIHSDMERVNYFFYPQEKKALVKGKLNFADGDEQ